MRPIFFWPAMRFELCTPVLEKHRALLNKIDFPPSFAEITFLKNCYYKNPHFKSCYMLSHLLSVIFTYLLTKTTIENNAVDCIVFSLSRFCLPC